MTVAAVADGVLANLSARIPDVAKVELIDRNGPRALEMVRHDLAHVFAEAVWTLWPGTRTAIGPRLDMAFFLRLCSRCAFHARRSSRDREDDAGDHRCAHAFHLRGLDPRSGERQAIRLRRRFGFLSPVEKKNAANHGMSQNEACPVEYADIDELASLTMRLPLAS